MDFGATHRPLKRLDVGPLAARILSAPAALWDSDEGIRQAVAGPRPTRSSFLLFTNAAYMPQGRRVTQADIIKRAGWEWFIPVVQPILDALLAFYPPGGTVIRAQIANLLPGGEIARHQDVSPLLRMAHRVHVPVITWPEVAFHIDDQPFKFEAGEAFELNNQKFHYVRNDGEKDRHHLIFDYLPADYDMAAIAAVQANPALMANLKVPD